MALEKFEQSRHAVLTDVGGDEHLAKESLFRGSVLEHDILGKRIVNQIAHEFRIAFTMHAALEVRDTDIQFLQIALPGKCMQRHGVDEHAIQIENKRQPAPVVFVHAVENSMRSLDEA